MTEELSERELAELARVFASACSAVQLLDRAGLSRARQPVFQQSYPLMFWREVSLEIAAGALADGRRRILAEAARDYPRNRVFRRHRWPRSWRRLALSPLARRSPAFGLAVEITLATAAVTGLALALRRRRVFSRRRS